MKIVKPSVTLLSITSEPEKLIERIGRIAYKSEDKITEYSYVKFIQNLIARGHESVLEHASASLLFICDRGVANEIVRHRISSFTQESTRYCNYKNGIEIVEPPLSEILYPHWLQTMHQCEQAYSLLLPLGPQIARSVLPTCLKTEIAMTANFRTWRNFFKLRCAKTAHPQMQEVANMSLTILKENAPIVFEDMCP